MLSRLGLRGRVGNLLLEFKNASLGNRFLDGLRKQRGRMRIFRDPYCSAHFLGKLGMNEKQVDLVSPSKGLLKGR